ncbi:helix-turn-helix domain-containing protein [Gabonia massiliensis]|uniref:helix-turn-helix domain-containing protein n=1 Tax=Gabonia massiliensis TaxID=1686296 RepID=UPI0006D7DD88|nr:helix-turn-helix domain-containing protein [Gabonia massiliensis]
MNIQSLKHTFIIYIILSFIFTHAYAREKIKFRHVSIYGNNHPVSFLQTDSIIKLRIMPPHLQSIICKIQKQKNIIECPRTLFYTDYIYFSDPDMNAIAFNLYMTYLFLDRNDRTHALALCNKIENDLDSISEKFPRVKSFLKEWLNLLYANIYIGNKQNHIARLYLKRFDTHNNPALDIPKLETFARYYFSSDKYDKALAVTDSIIQKSQKSSIYIPALYYKASIFEKWENYEKANEIYKEINLTKDSILNELISEYSILKFRKYNKSKHFHEISGATISSIFLIITLICIGFFNRSWIDTFLHKLISQIPKRVSTSNSNIQKENTTNHEEILFNQIQDIMKRKKLFKIPSYSLEELSMELCTNRSYISKSINKYGQMNFNQWLNSLRIDYILSRLPSDCTLANLKEIAFESGFASMATFNRAFLAVTGVSPNQYLEQKKVNLEESKS